MTEPLASGDPAIDHGEIAIACVDVLIAARDRADTIERAVQSALAQDEVRAVILVDDGSTDETAVRASQCDPQGKRLTIKRLRSSVGPSAARNIALNLSTAPWIAVLDGDDFFLPGRLSALLFKSGDWDLVADDIVLVRDDTVDQPVLQPVLFSGHREPFVLRLEQFVLGNVRRHGILRTELGFIKPVIRRSFLDAHHLRYDEMLRLGEDYALYARALAAGARFLIVPVPGYASVWRADSLSGRHTKQDLERLRESDAELIVKSKLTRTEQRALRRHYLSIDCRVQWLTVIEAFGSRQYLHAIAAFTRSPTVTAFLISRLIEEFQQRAIRRIQSLASTTTG